MSTTAVAAMLSTILYSRRFFPYYTDNIIAGLDNEGEHKNYSIYNLKLNDFEKCAYNLLKMDDLKQVLKRV